MNPTQTAFSILMHPSPQTSQNPPKKQKSNIKIVPGQRCLLLDAGQKLGPSNCVLCGMQYYANQSKDCKQHANYCDVFLNGVAVMPKVLFIFDCNAVFCEIKSHAYLVDKRLTDPCLQAARYLY